MNLLRQYKGQFLITLILFLAILIMPFQDYTERTFLLDEMNYPEDSIGIVQSADGLMTVPDNAGSITLNSNRYYLKRGTYEVTFDVRAQAEGNTVEVCDPLYIQPDNTAGKTLALASVPTTGEMIRLTFSVEDYLECIEFRVHTESAAEFASIYLMSQRNLYLDPYIYAGLLLLASALLLIYRTRRKVRPEVLVLLAFAALWSCLPLCFTWLSNGHDLFFHYGRLFSLSKELSNGFFPVRIHSGMYRGFSYMSSVFYPEFFLYPFALFGILGMSPIGCYKLLLICINFATAGLSYYSFSRLFRSRKHGLTAALLYTLSMYRFINLYTRAAIGEILATLFLPLLVLAMYQLFLGDSRRWFTAVLAFTALFQSHLITTELAIGFSLLFGLCNIRRLKDKKRLLHLILGAVSTLLLNLWFILPFLDHMRYSVCALNDVRNLAGYSVYAAQFFSPVALNPSGEALGRGELAGEMPYSIGLVLLLGCILFLFIYIRKKHKDFHLKLGAYSLLLGILCLYASSSYFPWEAVQRIELINRLAGNIQFAYRFLPFATLFLCLTAAVGICNFFQSQDSKRMLFIVCGLLMAHTSGSFFSSFSNDAPIFVSWENQMDHALDTDTLYLISNNGEYFSVRKMWLQEVTFTPSENVALTDCSRKGTDAVFTYTKTEAANEVYVDVPYNYYPYFRAYDSAGNPLSTSHGELIRLRVHLPDALSDTITIRFELPGYYRVGDLISLLTAVVFLALWILSRYSRSKKGKPLPPSAV